MVAAWSLDRLSRSLQHLVTFLGELHAKGIDLYLHQQGIDTSTPAGEAMFGMKQQAGIVTVSQDGLGVFAQFERARVRAQGKRLGRLGLNDKQEAMVHRLLAEGVGIVKTARLAGVGVSSVQRIKSGERPKRAA